MVKSESERGQEGNDKLLGEVLFKLGIKPWASVKQGRPGRTRKGHATKAGARQGTGPLWGRGLLGLPGLNKVYTGSAPSVSQVTPWDLPSGPGRAGGNQEASRCVCVAPESQPREPGGTAPRSILRPLNTTRVTVYSLLQGPPLSSRRSSHLPTCALRQAHGQAGTRRTPGLGLPSEEFCDQILFIRLNRKYVSCNYVIGR